MPTVTEKESFKEKSINDVMIFLHELIQFDEVLILLPALIGAKNFGIIVKSLAGKTLRIPTKTEFNYMVKKARNLSRRLKGKKIPKVTPDERESLTALMRSIDDIHSVDVRKARKMIITSELFKSYFDKIFDKTDEFIREIKSDNPEFQIRLYDKQLEEFKLRTHLVEIITRYNSK